MLLFTVFLIQLKALSNECKTGSHCLTCSIGDNSFCLTCEPGYGLDYDSNGNSLGICKRCSPNFCQSCEDDYKICTKCNNPYLLTANSDGKSTGGCSECNIDHCLRCDKYSSICSQCEEGYGFKEVHGSVICEACANKGCETCTKYDVCDEYYCPEGQGRDLTSGEFQGQCKSCSISLYKKYYDNYQQCDECLPNSYPVMNNDKIDNCNQCPENCEECDGNTGCKEHKRSLSYRRELENGKYMYARNAKLMDAKSVTLHLINVTNVQLVNMYF